jgi:hypothetical protein
MPKASYKRSLLLQRIAEAEESQRDDMSGGFRQIHDPIKDDPRLTSTVAAAEKDAEAELAGVKRGRGFCHLIWRTKKRILLAKNGVEWFSPAEMSPGCRFD